MPGETNRVRASQQDGDLVESRHDLDKAGVADRLKLTVEYRGDMLADPLIHNHAPGGRGETESTDRDGRVARRRRSEAVRPLNHGLRHQGCSARIAARPSPPSACRCFSCRTVAGACAHGRRGALLPHPSCARPTGQTSPTWSGSSLWVACAIGNHAVLASKLPGDQGCECEIPGESRCEPGWVRSVRVPGRVLAGGGQLPAQLLAQAAGRLAARPVW
jgi:hypothetical protein